MLRVGVMLRPLCGQGESEPVHVNDDIGRGRMLADIPALPAADVAGHDMDQRTPLRRCSPLVFRP